MLNELTLGLYSFFIPKTKNNIIYGWFRFCETLKVPWFKINTDVENLKWIQFVL